MISTEMYLYKKRPTKTGVQRAEQMLQCAYAAAASTYGKKHLREMSKKLKKVFLCKFVGAGAPRR